MTPYERENPSVLNSSRKKRIAAGCGLDVVDINRLLKQFDMMQQMTRQFTGKNMSRKMKRGGGTVRWQDEGPALLKKLVDRVSSLP